VKHKHVDLGKISVTYRTVGSKNTSPSPDEGMIRSPSHGSRTHEALKPCCADCTDKLGRAQASPCGAKRIEPVSKSWSQAPSPSVRHAIVTRPIERPYPVISVARPGFGTPLFLQQGSKRVLTDGQPPLAEICEAQLGPRRLNENEFLEPMPTDIRSCLQGVWNEVVAYWPVPDQEIVPAPDPQAPGGAARYGPDGWCGQGAINYAIARDGFAGPVGSGFVQMLTTGITSSCASIGGTSAWEALRFATPLALALFLAEATRRYDDMSVLHRLEVRSCRPGSNPSTFYNPIGYRDMPRGTCRRWTGPTITRPQPPAPRTIGPIHHEHCQDGFIRRTFLDQSTIDIFTTIIRSLIGTPCDELFRATRAARASVCAAAPPGTVCDDIHLLYNLNGAAGRIYCSESGETVLTEEVADEWLYGLVYLTFGECVPYLRFLL